VELSRPVAWVGAVGILLLAWAIRRRWLLLADLAPGTPERRLWVCLGTANVLAAHLVTSMWLIGTGMRMHTTAMHILGIDSWTLVAAAVIAYFVVREADARVDERDVLIAHEARRGAWHFEFALLTLLIVALGFGWMPQFSHAAIAHVLILLLTLTMAVECALGLRAYRGLAREAAP
jgi:hypothetical protein